MAKFLDGEMYIRKYPKFQTITEKLKRAKACFNLFASPFVMMKTNKKRLSSTAQRGNMAYVFIIVSFLW